MRTPPRLGLSFLGISVLALLAPAARAAEPPPPPAAAAAVTLPALRYVDSLERMAELMKADDLMAARARALETRRTTAMGVGFGGMALGAGLSLVAMGAGPSECVDVGAGTVCHSTPSTPLLISGLVLSGASAIAMMAIGPRRYEVYDLVNEWNDRHRDQPLLVDSCMGRWSCGRTNH